MDIRFELKWKVGPVAAANIAAEAMKYSATIALLSRTGSWVKATVGSEWLSQRLLPGSKVRLLIYGQDEEEATNGLKALFALAAAPKKAVGRTAKPS